MTAPSTHSDGRGMAPRDERPAGTAQGSARGALGLARGALGPALFALLVVIALGALLSPRVGRDRLDASPYVASFADTIARLDPSIVRVVIRQADGTRRRSRDDGVGAGFIIAPGGWVATSAHVLAGAREVWVSTPGMAAVVARVVGADQSSDVALLHVPELAGREMLPRGDVSTLRKGDWVLAAGSPYGLENSWSVGIVSGLARSGVGIDPRGIESYIQTDASANRGSSGGPLCDANGRVVGQITAIMSRTGGDQGVTLATPIDLVADAARRLGAGAGGRVAEPPSLGLVLRPAEGRLVVVRLDAGGPAAQAGFQLGDALLRVEGRPITDAADLQRAVVAGLPGQPLAIEVLRAGRTLLLRATLR